MGKQEISEDFFIALFLPHLREGGNSLALHLSEHFSITEADNTACLCQLPGFHWERSLAYKNQVPGSKIARLGFSFMSLGLTVMIEVWQQQHKITTVQTAEPIEVVTVVR